MAVYTKLTFEDIADFLANYDIGNLVSFKEIIDGIDNSNFIINTSNGRFILTIFESRINKSELPFFISLKAHLARKKVCCPKPISNNFGSLINNIKDKPALIVTFLDGATLKPESNGMYKEITTKHCHEIGKNLALLHLGVKDFDLNRENDLGVNGFEKLFYKMDDKIEAYQQGLGAEIIDYLLLIKNNWRFDMESGVVHADLFPDNVFFNEKSQVSGIIDFYFSATDSFIYDLAIVINAWSFDENNDFSQDRYQNILDGYNQVRKLTNDEEQFLKIALIAASMRFLLTRLYDKFNTPKDSLVKIKDPQEYLKKIRFFYSSFLQEKKPINIAL